MVYNGILRQTIGTSVMVSMGHLLLFFCRVLDNLNRFTVQVVT